MMDGTLFRGRRTALAAAAGGPILLVAHTKLPRNYLANPMPFRQCSTFLFYVGLALPDLAAIIEDDGSTTLFVPPVDPGDALWHGALPSPRALADAAGAEHVAFLPDLRPAPRLALPSADPIANLRASQWSQRALDPRRPTSGEHSLLDAVINQRMTRDGADLGAMREAAAVTARGHRAAMAATRDGATEHGIAALVDGCFASFGMPTAYPSIVTATGEVLHGHPTSRVLRDGDLLLVDAGAEHPSGLASDVTRTWPVSGRFSPRQRDAYEAVLQAQAASLSVVRPGARYRDVHLAACRSLAASCVDMGLLRGDVDGLVESGAHAAFFPHGVGHLLGHDVHDLELYGDRAGYAPGRTRSDQFGLASLRLDRDLVEGMAVTIEPGFYVVPAILDDAALRERLGDSVRWDEARRWLPFGGIRIEDDVVVTADGCENLTAAIPKAIAEVETLVGSGSSVETRFG